VTTTAVPGEPDPREAAEAEAQVSYRRFDCTAGDPSQNTEATEAARQAIEAGECIVLPTDTVYGVGCDAFDADAVAAVLAAKGRGRDMPPPVLIGESTLIRALAVDVPEMAKDLVEKHWPGALTVICHIQPSLRMDLGETEGPSPFGCRITSWPARSYDVPARWQSAARTSAVDQQRSPVTRRLSNSEIRSRSTSTEVRFRMPAARRQPSWTSRDTTTARYCDEVRSVSKRSVRRRQIFLI